MQRFFGKGGRGKRVMIRKLIYTIGSSNDRTMTLGYLVNKAIICEHNLPTYNIYTSYNDTYNITYEIPTL